MEVKARVGGYPIYTKKFFDTLSAKEQVEYKSNVEEFYQDAIDNKKTKIVEGLQDLFMNEMNETLSRGTIGDNIKETVKDMAAIIPQSLFMNWADELEAGYKTGSFSGPEYRKEQQKLEKHYNRIRSRSRFFTTVTDIITPAAPLKAIKWVGKAYSAMKAAKTAKTATEVAKATKELTKLKKMQGFIAEGAKGGAKGFGAGYVYGKGQASGAKTSSEQHDEAMRSGYFGGAIGIGSGVISRLGGTPAEVSSSKIKPSPKKLEDYGEKVSKRTGQTVDEAAERLMQEKGHDVSKGLITTSTQIGKNITKKINQFKQKAKDLVNKSGAEMSNKESDVLFKDIKKALYKGHSSDKDREIADKVLAEFRSGWQNLRKDGRSSIDAFNKMKREMYKKMGGKFLKTGSDEAVMDTVQKAIVGKVRGKLGEKYGKDWEKTQKELEGYYAFAKEPAKKRISEFTKGIETGRPSEVGMGEKIIQSTREVVGPIKQQAPTVGTAAGITIPGSVGSQFGTKDPNAAELAEKQEETEVNLGGPDEPEEGMNFGPTEIKDIPPQTMVPGEQDLERGIAGEEEQMMEPEQPQDPRMQMIAEKRLLKEMEQMQAMEEKLISTPLPRNSKDFLDNSQFAIAKISAQRPDIAPQWMEMIKNAPHLLEEHLMGLAMEDPNMMEHDPYNRINDRVIDNNMKSTIRTQIAQNTELTNLQKTEQLDELNRSGIWKDSEVAPEAQEEVQEEEAPKRYSGEPANVSSSARQTDESSY